ncbi:hypothetical protein Tasa_048_058 [Tanticharoenia sakaeratensis NBRC 103193]|uniref:Uncharacterized protein n=1 Tax=Tanticharoenia sakaeratensis NBRC 103193 TaxID=1231623 RepID=A0A0D6MQ64_9PROT|nr:hypothetical protein Tasa_048_058 [Tanticharoenia sakaeratensis NBRC 103193]
MVVAARRVTVVVVARAVRAPAAAIRAAAAVRVAVRVARPEAGPHHVQAWSLQNGLTGGGNPPQYEQTAPERLESRCPGAEMRLASPKNIGRLGQRRWNSARVP